MFKTKHSTFNGAIVSYFTVSIHAGIHKDSVETFQAKDFSEAIDIVVAKYPDTTYRLYLGKTIPERKVSQPIPPTLPKK